MQVSKVPPPEVPTGRTATAPNAEAGSQSPPATSAVDRADIRPLDAQAALQILVAEVRAGLDAFLLAAMATSARAAPVPAPATNPSQAAQQLVELFLRALPPESEPQAQAMPLSQVEPQSPIEPQAWLSAAAQAQEVLGRSIDAALLTIGAWRAVPPAVVDVPREAHMMLQAALTEEPLSPVWLRPEWLGLEPRIQRFWRRRRRMQRRLSDPDYRSGYLDDDTESSR